MKFRFLTWEIVIRKYVEPKPKKPVKVKKPRPNYCLHKDKRMYTREEAHAQVKRQTNLMKKYPALHLRSYMCMFCQAWHLTKQHRNN